MKGHTINRILTVLIALVWLINGLVFKVLNCVPRHQEIVANILGEGHSRILTISIGVSEIAMAIWVISRIKSRVNAVVQVIVVATMNVLEFLMIPDLLLWGRLNSFFAFLFICVVWYNEYVLNQNHRTEAKL